MQPVSTAEFPQGNEFVLWNPDLNATLLRAHAAWVAVWPAPAITIALGSASAVVSYAHGRWIIGSLVVVIVVLAGLHSVVTFLCFPNDHCHPGKSCVLDRVPGRFLYRPSHFTTHPPGQRARAEAIIHAVHDLHTIASEAWVPDQHLRQAHRAAWDILHALDRIHAARMLTTHAVLTPELAEPIRLLTADIATIDRAVDRVQACLIDTVALARAWQQKVEYLNQTWACSTESGQIAQHSSTTMLRAQDLVEGFFAAVTAARDLLRAGPFEWEHHPPPHHTHPHQAQDRP